jgi:hypothetical protein
VPVYKPAIDNTHGTKVGSLPSPAPPPGPRKQLPPALCKEATKASKLVASPTPVLQSGAKKQLPPQPPPKPAAPKRVPLAQKSHKAKATPAADVSSPEPRLAENDDVKARVKLTESQVRVLAKIEQSDPIDAVAAAAVWQQLEKLANKYGVRAELKQTWPHPLPVILVLRGLKKNVALVVAEIDYAVRISGCSTSSDKYIQDSIQRRKLVRR